jgi:hypothetical protein
MMHDKIRAAVRRRMAVTGEPYAAARRAVIRERQQAAGPPPPAHAQRFLISFSDAWQGRLTAVLDAALFRSGPGVAHVDVDPAEIRFRMATFKLDIPRGSVLSARHSPARVGRTAGVHGWRGRWLVNGSADGLVEVDLDPPCRLPRSVDTLLRVGRSRVDAVTVSLEDPDGFIAAVIGGRGQ